MAWVYFLRSNDGRLYIGSTTDLSRRMNQHKHGQTPTTHRMGTLQLVFSQSYPTIREAREVERRLKGLKRRDYLERIITDGQIKMRVAQPRRS